MVRRQLGHVVDFGKRVLDELLGLGGLGLVHGGDRVDWVATHVAVLKVLDVIMKQALEPGLALRRWVVTTWK